MKKSGIGSYLNWNYIINLVARLRGPGLVGLLENDFQSSKQFKDTKHQFNTKKSHSRDSAISTTGMQ
jgi:hypothetical protein